MVLADPAVHLYQAAVVNGLVYLWGGTAAFATKGRVFAEFERSIIGPERGTTLMRRLAVCRARPTGTTRYLAIRSMFLHAGSLIPESRSQASTNPSCNAVSYASGFGWRGRMW